MADNVQGYLSDQQEFVRGSVMKGVIMKYGKLRSPKYNSEFYTIYSITSI